MNPGFEEALASWEAGDLSRDELARRFPNEDVTGLLTAFERMQAVGTGPTPDPGEAWEAVRPQLPVRLEHRRKRPRGVRLLAAALVALLAMGATAYAFVPGVRRAVDAAFDRVISSDEGSTGQATETLDPLVANDLVEDEPDADDPAPGEEQTSPGTEGREDDESDGDEQGEDVAGGGQGQDEDEGTGPEQGDDATPDGDQEHESQGGSQEGSGGTASSGAGQDDGGTDQPQVGDSGN